MKGTHCFGTLILNTFSKVVIDEPHTLSMGVAHHWHRTIMVSADEQCVPASYIMEDHAQPNSSSPVILLRGRTLNYCLLRSRLIRIMDHLAAAE